MKKEYGKPYLAVESFQMTAALAAGCTLPLQSDGTALLGGLTFVDGGNGNCKYNLFDDTFQYLGDMWIEAVSTYATS